jgi:hypothetical protein
VARVPSALTATVTALTTVIVPLSPVPAQTLSIALGDQPCRIDVYQKSTGLYLNLYVADRPVVLGVLCRDRNVLVVDSYHGFTGDLSFYDTQGLSDPYYDALGSRWQLLWLL